MFIDKNKDIGTTTQAGITYNHLNLPSNIFIRRANGAVKGRIQYQYDAFGNKVRKIVSDSTVSPTKVTTTLCLGGGVYENDTLQLLGHEEGRLRYTKRRFVSGDSAYQFQYDYFLKDHLGNVAHGAHRTDRYRQIHSNHRSGLQGQGRPTLLQYPTNRCSKKHRAGWLSGRSIINDQSGYTRGQTQWQR